MSAGIIERLYEFTVRWTLNNDAQDKLAALPRNLQDLAISQFEQVDGVVEGADQSGKFITFASGLMTAFGGASGQGAAKRPTTLALAPPQKAARWEAGPGGAWQADGGMGERVQQFVELWSLNQDAVDRLQRLSPSALEVVLNEFDATALGPGVDCNGKLISFASKVNAKHMREQGLFAGDKGWGKGDKGWGKGAKGWDAWSPPCAGGWYPPAAAMWAPMGKGFGKAGKAKGGKSSPVDASPVDTAQLQAFIDTWNLNQDAVDKIQKLSPAAVKVVLSQFAPEGESADWNGKFIKFANGVEQNHKGDPVVAFVQQWGLNEDAQTKLYRLAAEDPSVLQKVLKDFKPTMELPDYSGMLIGFATSVFKRMRQEAAAMAYA